ncbi:hypothetical protein ACFO4E_29805 [Nocardiopsis mangrovi]|uniref:Uncharacterized protein n=1 Tax=Nocardiopsis mangrovi TaxID=1179818 RepID=A0ABV9E4F4_9ACTN
MPRNRPGALRARRPLPRISADTPPKPIDGLSLRTCRAVHTVEALPGGFPVFPGCAELALRRYREFLSAPGGRPLYPRPAPCQCRICAMDDVTHARDVLEAVMVRLPVRPRAELRRLAAPLDTAFLRRTLPDPRARSGSSWPAEPWWHHRIGQGDRG